MIEVPTDPTIAIRLYQDILQIKNLPVFIAWLGDQVGEIDKHNRYELDDTIWKHRQGAAQAIEKLIEIIEESSTEVANLYESQQNGGKGNVF